MPLIRAAVLSPVEGTFVYDLPEEMAEGAAPGTRLRLPFGRSLREGFLVDFGGEPKPGLKSVAQVLSPELSIAPELLELTRWVSEYYFAPWGEVLMAAVPMALGRRPVRPRKAAAAGDSPVALPAEGMIVAPRPRQLSAQQAQAIDAITASLRGGGFEAHLLDGVTGSGKTEVYLGAAEEVVRAGGQVLALVPEIALSPLLLARFSARFPGRVVALHSRQTDRERREGWLRARSGDADVVLGVRSGVFAPLPRLRLVVVDEEHEPSYKQLEGLQYHARDVAVKRSQLAGAVIVLGSATPSLESRANVLKGRYRRLALPERIDRRPLPRVDIVDLRMRELLKRSQVLSEPLLAAMEDCLSRDEQIILFLNRRGFAAALQCRSCGLLARCPDCDVTLTLHQKPAQLRCHYCDRREVPWTTCPTCQGLDLRPAGAGTQRVETELARLFPGVPLVRMDLDTTRGRTSHADLLREFERRRASILLGTQMVAKGHDFPGVTLVGVVLADVQLYTPDFRAGERTFQLLTQVAGRAGRGDQPGRVIFQTYLPTHPAVLAAREHGGEEFYRTELEERQAFGFPPAMRLISFRLSGKVEADVRRAAEALASRAAAHPAAGGVGRLGPAPAPIARIRNTWRFHLLLRSADLKALRAVAADLWKEARRPQKGIRVDIDVDPIETG